MRLSHDAAGNHPVPAHRKVTAFSDSTGMLQGQKLPLDRTAGQKGIERGADEQRALDGSGKKSGFQEDCRTVPY